MVDDLIFMHVAQGNGTLKNLNLSRNEIGDLGCQHLARGVEVPSRYSSFSKCRWVVEMPKTTRREG